MAALSVFIEEGVPPHLCANPIYVTSREGETLIFEVLEKDVSHLLERLVGKPELYSLGGETFFGQLVSLEPCQNTAEACQGRSKNRPMGRSKSRPGEYVEDRGLSGRRASGAILVQLRERVPKPFLRGPDEAYRRSSRTIELEQDYPFKCLLMAPSSRFCTSAS
jgi:hypothetical protein